MKLKDSVQVNLKIPAGQSSPSPAIASALGQRGVNIVKFFEEFAALTSKGFEPGKTLIVVVFVKKNKAFKIIIKGRPLSDMIKEALKITKGSATPGKNFVSSIDDDIAELIAKEKLPFTNAYDEAAAINMVFGTARSMGIKINRSNNE